MTNETLSTPHIVDKELKYKGWGKLEKFKLRFSDPGSISDGEAEWEVFNSNGDGACALLVNEAKTHVLLTRQYRLPAYLHEDHKGFLIEVCAGKLDNQEPLEAIRREILEETGYEVKHIEYLYTGYSSPGSLMERIHFFTAVYNEDMKVHSGGGVSAENEQIEILEWPIDDMINAIYDGEIIDSKSIILAQHLEILKLKAASNS